jgi:S-DNA-T family DNA segregation ATPase FtsK/SpoIIIE
MVHHMLRLLELLAQYRRPAGNLICLLGQTSSHTNIWMDLSDNPHMIVSGTTGSGKSILLHNIIANVLDANKSIIELVDPKNIEFYEYEKLSHRDINVCYSYDDALSLLNRLIVTMEKRYELMRSGRKGFPPVLLIIDELADLIIQDGRDKLFFKGLCKLAQKCRAANMSIILSTQRPAVSVISGAIKANFPARIACRVTNKTDSRVILDCGGAEKLIGKGDALLKDSYRQLERFQIAYTDAAEVCKRYGPIASS